MHLKQASLLSKKWGAPQTMKYKEIRNSYQDHNYIEKIFVDPYAMLISPIFTKLFLKLKATPNQVTVMMMLSGIIGAILFAIPNNFIKIVGIVFIHIWYILDCSDGEVAKITKKFSKFGTEIDFTAHVVNHPLFNIAFAFCMISLNKYNSELILFLFMILIGFNLAMRNLLSFDLIYNLKSKKNERKEFSKFKKKKQLAIYFVGFFVQYPNFALIFPILYYIDLNFNTKISFIYLILVTIMSILIVSRGMVKWINRIVNSY
jgi:phosphatidylserine synthase